MELIKGLLALLALLAYGVGIIALLLLPTFLNLVVSALFTYPLWRVTKNRWVLVPVFLTISFVLAMNVRVFEVVSDIASQNSIIKKFTSQRDHASVSVRYGTVISLKTDTDMITYKRKPFNTSRSGSSSLGSPAHYLPPELSSESIAETLLAYGLVVGNGGENSLFLEISTASHNNLLYVNLRLKDRGELVAEESLRLRQKHTGDPEYGFRLVSSEGLVKLLRGNTVWNFILPLTGLLPEQNPVLKKFLEDHIRITSGIREPQPGLVTVLEDPVLDPRYVMMQPGRLGDRHHFGCDPREVDEVGDYRRKNVQLTRGGTVRLLELDTRYVNRILCAEDRIYLVETPGPKRDHLAVYEYDFDGVNHGNHQFTLPIKDWPATVEGNLIYLQITGDGFVAGLSQKRSAGGRQLPPRHFYYHLGRANME